MKQVVQNLRSGVLELMDVPCPAASRGQLLIQSQASLISAGTERFLVEFGKASLVSKARQNPDRVKQVLDKIKADGLLPTLETVFNKLDEPLPLGYCNSGIVVGVGAGVEGYEVGDKVASNGQHAEFVKVPVNLCAKVPDNVPHEEAAFAVLGSIALQGIRLVKPELGETVVVFGLGLVGLLAVQMLVANGVKVIGIDLSDDRLAWAKQAGAQVIDPKTTADPVAAALAATGGRGVDAVLITASAKNDSIVSQSAKMCRQRGRVVLVGVVNLELDRADFYEKEISFQVSCSYGPGRYDDDYEQKGIDYPYGFVRWTEQRNIQAVLDLMHSGKLDVKPLITHRFAHADAV
ncbi:MAG: zinc-binding alcohol dehydrogenase, partial [Planctomycetales bacterium]|nr:zinc-binding alcohol dehydrogenase [Planctomycetales bacterium]